jgi:ribonuclease BN (tRNA processing enzyme)
MPSRAALLVLALALVAVACGGPGEGGAGVGAGDPFSPPPGEGGRTRVVVLGTGTPVPDPARSGPAVAVVVAVSVYLVDAGAGVVRRAAAAYENGEWALRPENLDRVFVTHLHSDHTIGIPDVLHMGWIQGRADPLEIFGPPGIADMSKYLELAWAADVEVRRRDDGDRYDEGHRIQAVEIAPGIVYQDERVRVTAFPVEHGAWEHAFGFRFDTADRSIVISGDAAPSETVVEACDGCDLLIHEVYSAAAFALLGSDAQGYHSSFHTSTEELADLATRARAAKLVLYHQLYFGADDEMLIEEVRAAGFTGELESARDLGVY